MVPNLFFFLRGYCNETCFPVYAYSFDNTDDNYLIPVTLPPGNSYGYPRLPQNYFISRNNFTHPNKIVPQIPA